MKKIFKKEVIIAFIIGIILASSIAVYAYSYYAKDISYTKPGETQAISVEAALNDLYNNKNATLLWTNSSPNSNFNAQTISLNLQNYKYLIIINKTYTEGDNLPRTTSIIPVGEVSFPNASTISGTSTSRYRTANANINGVTFSNELKNGDNNEVIPLSIYGIKTDLGIWNEIIGE